MYAYVYVYVYTGICTCFYCGTGQESRPPNLQSLRASRKTEYIPGANDLSIVGAV